MKKSPLLSLLLLLQPAVSCLAQTNHAVISEVFVGSATGDWIELYNPTSSDIVMTNWTLQYASASATQFTSKYIFSGTIPKGGFYLVASSGFIGSVTPDKNSSTTLQLGNAGGRIALCNANVTLSGTAPGQPSMLDFVGYGTAVSAEGNSPASAPGSTGSLERKAIPTSTAATMASGGADALKGNGYDTDNNSNNFTTRAVPEPQNSASTIEPEAFAPVFTANYPAATGVGTTDFVLQSKINEAGTTYYVVLPQSATAPTSAQVKAGQDATGTAAPLAGAFGHANLDSVYSKTVSGLSTGTTYRVYTVAEDSLNNLQAAPVLLTVSTSTPLPISLTAFSAEVRGGAVALYWHTASEQASREFVVERSADGRQYAEVARVAAAGTAATPQDYRAEDATPLAGTSYYRLRQLDYDGTVSTSPTRAVRIPAAAATGLHVVPNPFSNRLAIQVAETGNLEAVVYDLQGRVRFSASGTLGALNAGINEAAAALEPGVYVLQLHGTGTAYQERLIKK